MQVFPDGLNIARSIYSAVLARFALPTRSTRCRLSVPLVRYMFRHMTV